MPDLLNCPFCGNSSPWVSKRFIHCDECGVQFWNKIDYPESSTELIAAWNTRADLRDIKVQLEKAVETLQEMCAEFRGRDLPYGSKAYLKAIAVLAEIKKGGM